MILLHSSDQIHSSCIEIYRSIDAVAKSKAIESDVDFKFTQHVAR